MSFLDRFIDHSPALRLSRAESIGRIIAKRFIKDAGFGDCPQVIDFEFPDPTGVMVKGSYTGTESSFHGVAAGDPIVIRYLESEPSTCAPRDSLGIITRADGSPLMEKH
jgi:hypothetical protein